MEPSQPFTFDDETTIEPIGPGRWSTFIHSAWNINTNPNGGYAMTPLILALASEADGHPDPVSVTVRFLRPAVGGETGELSVSTLRKGRRTSTVEGTMVQGDKPRLHAVATFADLAAGPVGPAGFAIERPDLAPPEACPERSAVAQGADLPLLDRVEVRLDPDIDVPGGSAVAGWIRFRDGREPDALTLPLFADCFPPPIFSRLGRIGWVPTVELTAHIRRRPAPGWISGMFTTRDVAGGFLIEDGVLWDSTGEVVAQSRQLALTAD